MLLHVINMTMLNRPAEIFPHHIRRAWLDDNRVALIIVSGDATREAADALLDITMQTIQDWPAEQPLLIMYDLTQLSDAASLYALKRLSDVYDTLPADQISYCAVILGGGLVNTVICRLLRRYRNSPVRNERTFTDRKEAHAWLRQARISVRGELLV